MHTGNDVETFNKDLSHTIRVEGIHGEDAMYLGSLQMGTPASTLKIPCPK